MVNIKSSTATTLKQPGENTTRLLKTGYFAPQIAYRAGSTVHSVLVVVICSLTRVSFDYFSKFKIIMAPRVEITSCDRFCDVRDVNALAHLVYIVSS